MSRSATAQRSYYVYILSNIHRTLYTGVTSDPRRRIYEHKSHQVPGFTARYGIDRLVIIEEAPTALEAIAREKQIKAWSRAKKVALIESTNPRWEDLSADWYDDAHSG